MFIIPLAICGNGISNIYNNCHYLLGLVHGGFILSFLGKFLKPQELIRSFKPSRFVCGFEVIRIQTEDVLLIAGERLSELLQTAEQDFDHKFAAKFKLDYQSSPTGTRFLMTHTNLGGIDYCAVGFVSADFAMLHFFKIKFILLALFLSDLCRYFCKFCLSSPFVIILLPLFLSDILWIFRN